MKPMYHVIINGKYVSKVSVSISISNTYFEVDSYSSKKEDAVNLSYQAAKSIAKDNDGTYESAYILNENDFPDPKDVVMSLSNDEREVLDAALEEPDSYSTVIDEDGTIDFILDRDGVREARDIARDLIHWLNAIDDENQKYI